jgi:glycosyltransferase involved in cell wall biosynthesis
MTVPRPASSSKPLTSANCGAAGASGGTSEQAAVRQPARLLFLVTEDWYFWGHRLALARAARAAGYTVVVATRVATLRDQISRDGFWLEPLHWQRGSVNPLRLVADVIDVARVYRRVRPDLAHHVSLKPILVGTLAASLTSRLAVLNALTGRGYAFTSRAPRARLLAGVLAPLLHLLLRRPRTLTLLENRDDQRFVCETIGAPPEQTAVNPGSGVDVRHFALLPVPAHEPVTIGCAARMLRIKGVADLVAASRLLRERNVPHRLVLAGGIDSESPDAIPQHTIDGWVRQDGVEWLGQIDDVRSLWRDCHIAALASLGGEGVPLSLVEAAACGRPIVATDVPGSRDIARDDVNGLVVPPGSAAALADALERLIRDQDLRERYAAEGRRIAETEFSSDNVIAATLALYRQLLATR